MSFLRELNAAELVFQVLSENSTFFKKKLKIHMWGQKKNVPNTKKEKKKNKSGVRFVYTGHLPSTRIDW